jgi:hypothetical protein
LIFFAPPPPYKSTPDFEVCDYTITPILNRAVQAKKIYAVPSVFKLEFKPQSIYQKRLEADWKCLKEVPPIKAINVQCHMNIYCQQYIITE